jgi:YrbI family 3-deoxy-D-manno-octulosonate 8-phosphate phosphatase
MSMTVAAAIPAKGTSSRVPSKNLARILGVPLFLWAANNLSRVLPKDSIYIDSDSDEIIELAEDAGFRVLRRPAELATNASTGNDLMLWQASQIDTEILIQHLPPMIFLRPETIRSGISLLEGGIDSVFGTHAEQVYTWDENGPLYDVKLLPNSFNLPHRYREGMGFYGVRKATLLRERVRICGRSRMIPLDKFEQVDIDTPEELAFARALASGLSTDHPLLSGLTRFHSTKRVKLIVCDVDGCLTNGEMSYVDDGSEIKTFHTRDGIAVSQAQAAGIEVAFLSSGYCEGHISARANRLGVSRVSVCREPKAEVLASWMRELQLKGDQVAYLGDDVNDLEAMKLCEITACPSDAHPLVKEKAKHVLSTPGGRGTLREFWDNIIAPQ